MYCNICFIIFTWRLYFIPFPLQMKFLVLSWGVFVEVSELGVNVQFVIWSVCKLFGLCFQLSNWLQFDSWALQQRFLLVDFMDLDSDFVFNPKDSRLKNMCCGISWLQMVLFQFWILNCLTRCSSSTALQMQIDWWVLTVLFFVPVSDFFWR